MDTVNAEAAGERTLGSGGALGEVFQQVMQGLSLIQDAVQQQERRTEERLREMERMMREAVAEQERRLQEEAARRAVTTALEEKLRRVEERVVALERLSPPSGGPKRDQPSDVKKHLVHLEIRMEQLEASTKRALQSVVLRVDTLLKQLETPSPPEGSPTSPSTSFSHPTTSSVSTSFFAPRPHSPCAATPRLTLESLEELGEQLLGAAEEGRESDVRRLLEEGADVHYTSWDERTPLVRACKSAHANIVSLLIGRGADVNARDTIGWTALHAASGDGSGRCTSLLIRAGALVDCANNDGRTPLHWAAWVGNEAAARALLAAGASKSVRDACGKTAKEYATTDILRKLLRP